MALYPLAGCRIGIEFAATFALLPPIGVNVGYLRQHACATGISVVHQARPDQELLALGPTPTHFQREALVALRGVERGFDDVVRL